MRAAAVAGFVLAALLGSAEAQSPDAAERAASAAEATAAAAEQSRDWLVTGLLAAAAVAGFGMAYRLA